MCQDPIMPGFGHLMSASHEITRLSVCLYVSLSVSFQYVSLKTGSLIFSDILHDDSWP